LSHEVLRARTAHWVQGAPEEESAIAAQVHGKPAERTSGEDKTSGACPTETASKTRDADDAGVITPEFTALSPTIQAAVTINELHTQGQAYYSLDINVLW
jgi:hypothetical protein